MSTPIQQPVRPEAGALREAIARLEESRSVIGDGAADAAIAALRSRLESIGTPVGQMPVRRQATIVFADLVSFTALSERMDAEELTELMNALWSRIDSCVEEHGGIVDKHMGDSVMAVWGAGGTRDDDARMALTASVAMISCVEQMGRDKGMDLRLRVGVNTGPVLFGGVGSTGETTAMGDTVNIASRLQKESPPGRIAMSGDTARLAAGAFELEDRGSITVRNREAPVQVYLAGRMLRRRFGDTSRGIAGVATQLVGRDAQLESLLSRSIHRAGGGGAGLALITGEAGIGKSRLLLEFESRLQGLDAPPRILRGRATPETANTPRGLLRNVFSEAFDLLESDPPPVVLDKMAVPGAEEAGRDSIAVLGHYLGFDLSFVPAVKRLLGGPSLIRSGRSEFLAFFDSLCQTGSVVMLLEDMHWSDESSIELVMDLLRTSPTAPLSIVCTARPEFLESNPNWAEEGRIEVIELKPLTAENSDELVSQIMRKAGELPASLKELLVNSAEGNPFYLEELVGMLIQDGVITIGSDSWSVEPAKLGRLRIPPSLRGLLEARLDALSPGEREVLQRASVVGRTFWDMAVSALLTEDDRVESIDGCLRTACAKNLLTRNPASRFEGAVEYAFRHALLRDVAYETVLLRKRRTYHMQAAKWLQSRAGDRISEYRSIIATHLEAAGDRVGASDMLSAAAYDLKHAGFALEAVAKYEKALELLEPAHPGRVALLVDIADALGGVSRFDESLAKLEEAHACAAESGDMMGQARALGGQGCIYAATGRLQEAERKLMESLEMMRELDNSAGVAIALNNLGSVMNATGRLEDARRLFEESLELRRASEDESGVGTCLNNLGTITHLLGDYAASISYYEQSLEIVRRDRNLRGISIVLSNLGGVKQAAGDLDGALKLLEESLQTRRRLGDRHGMVITLAHLGNTLRGLGDAEAAEEAYREGLELGRETGNRRGTSMCLLGYSDIAIEKGDFLSASRLALESASEANAVGAALEMRRALHRIARALLQMKRNREAAVVAGWLQSEAAAAARPEQACVTLMDELKSAMPAEDLERALARGRSSHISDLLRIISDALSE